MEGFTMERAVAVVEVHPAIDDLPADSPLAGMARRRFGGKSLLEWVVRRVSDADRISGVAVLAGEDSLARQLCKHCPPDVSVLHCPSRDPLGRLAAAARRLDCEGLVRLNVSHPFVDPDLIDRLIAEADPAECDYASYSFSDGRPVIESKLGVFAEWCSAAAIVRADRLAKQPADRSQATRFMHSRPDLFSLKLIAVPPRLDRDDLRLAIDDEEDWEELQTIFDALGPESLDWQFIASLVDRQPTMRARMAQRNRVSLCS
jgi:spore coat polysaccharide biosynthesis protein SpsF (cytidylyltransferase family)